MIYFMHRVNAARKLGACFRPVIEICVASLVLDITTYLHYKYI